MNVTNVQPEHVAAGSAPVRVEVSTLGALEPTMPTSVDWLTADETCRLATLGAPLRRRQFLAGHWLARRLAAAALDVATARVGMDRDDAGRPRLLLDGAPSAWHVSLAHSDDRVAGAVAPHPVGIDLEVPRRIRDLAALARFTFSPDENDALEAAGAHERVAVFYRLWALKEARGKHCGEGLLPRRARLATAVAAERDAAEAVTWTLDDVTLAVVAPDIATCRVAGVPDGARVAWWRFAEAAGLATP